jgi:hypothetical protein
MVDISEIVTAKQTARPERSVPVWLRLCGVTVGEAIGVLEPGSRKKVQTEDCMPQCGTCYCESGCCIDNYCGYVCCCSCYTC